MRKLFIAVLVLLVSSSLWAQDTRFYPSGGLQQGAGGSLTSSGPILLPNGTAGAPALSFSTEKTTGLYWATNGLTYFASTGTAVGGFGGGTTGGLYLGTSKGIHWGNSDDLQLWQDAADTFAQRRTTNPQTFNIYNTYTDVNNWERGYLKWSGNTFYVGTEKLGSGTARGLYLQYGGTDKLQIAAGGIYFQDSMFAGTGTQTVGGASGSEFKGLYITQFTQGYKSKTLTESAATSFVQIDLAASTGTGGNVSYCIFAKDASNTQMRCGTVAFAAARTSGSSITCTVGTPSTDLEATGITSGTLTNSFTCDATAGTNFKLQANAASSLTQSVLEIHYRLNMMDPQTVTPQ